jgi:hypothetical protein
MIRSLLLRWARGRKPVTVRRNAVYVSGPMSGLPNLNFEAFHRAAASLRASGYEVVNPAELTTDKAAAWEDCLRVDLIAMLHRCNRIAMLPGWEHSRGAKLELHVATALGMRPIFITQENV